MSRHQHTRPCPLCGGTGHITGRNSRPADSLIDRLYRYTPDRPAGGCWLWRGAMLPAGYGRLHWNYRHRFAHRLSYEAHIGPIPAGLILRHTCDQPSCINPAHLVPGTPKENTRDSIERGTHSSITSKANAAAKRGRQ